MPKTFEDFFNTLKQTNIEPSFYYTDHQKIAGKMHSFRKVLDELGYITSSMQFKNKFKTIYDNDKNAIEIIPLFSGVRPDKLVVIEDGVTKEKFNSDHVTFEEAMVFLQEVGFLDRIDAIQGVDLKSYYFGVEVGLDSNARKNRGGKQMERLVGGYIKDAGFEPGTFLEQVTIQQINDKFNLSFKTTNKKSKKFDFAIFIHKTIYIIEANFFNSSGSKTDINTRFIKLNNEIKKMGKDIVFMLITDGAGVKRARTEIEDVFNQIKHVYNIDCLEKGLFVDLKNKKI